MRLALKEVISNNFVYHNSPNPNIDVFVPKTVWRNEDWSSSGAEENPEYTKEEVVFAIDKQKALFYSLPRDTPRILLNKYHKEAKQYLKIKDNIVMFLPKNEKELIINHSWTEYKFDKKTFEKLPTDEWVSREEVRPVSKKTYKNPISVLEKSGYKIIWVDNINELAEELINKNFGFDAENI